MDFSWQHPLGPIMGDPPILNIVEYGAFYIIRNHIHPNLKSEYILEMDLSVFYRQAHQGYPEVVDL
jgi:hypothetical protein